MCSTTHQCIGRTWMPQPKQVTVHKCSSNQLEELRMSTGDWNHTQARVELTASKIHLTVVSEAVSPGRESAPITAFTCRPEWSSLQAKSISM